MAKSSQRKNEISDEERKKITQDMIEGYKKMAAINRELAEDGLVSDDETG